MLWVGNVGEVGGLLGGWETPPFALDFRAWSFDLKEKDEAGLQEAREARCGSQLLRGLGVKQV